jgi:MFS family permease
VPTAALEENRYQPQTRSYDGSIQSELDFNSGYVVRQRGGGRDSGKSPARYDLRDNPNPDLPQTSRGDTLKRTAFSLRGKTHVSLKEHHLKGFSLARSHKRQSVARDWSPGRKRFVAFVSCFSTALIGFLVGIYAGQTPSIQYYIVDFHHYTVLGNVFFFIGLAIPTFFCWPLPLLHGRKPYILGSLSIAMPLLFPQALVVGAVRSPYTAIWRVALILPRAAMGFVLGFANMNFRSQLTDVFGASLQSTNPHQEHVDELDVRRHGGGMGVWLGLWSWSALGSIGVGFMIGAIIINSLSPAWGFYLAIIIIAFVMLLNVLVPETRRSAYRRSVAEVANENGQVSRRLARGEVKMHMVKSGPQWWGEEFHWGVILSLKMLRQPGFMVMSVYVAWIYGQMVLTILVSKSVLTKRF